MKHSQSRNFLKVAIFLLGRKGRRRKENPRRVDVSLYPSNFFVSSRRARGGGDSVSEHGSFLSHRSNPGHGNGSSFIWNTCGLGSRLSQEGLSW